MHTLSPNSLVAGRYLLKRPIGGGGMGAVWLAEHVELRAPCAVKLIDREAARSPEFRRRFTREARAAALLRSTHVVQVLDSGDWRGQPYLVMELLEGEDLRECLLRTSRLPPAECVEIARQIARALTKAHAAGIVHRDLKPANVYLTHDDDRLVVKVLDFGIAKYDADLEATTDSGALLGTPHYMSPEQCRGAGQVDYRSDLWSLAVIVFECLTGSRPFPGPNLVQLVHQISVSDPPQPSAYRPGLPTALDLWWLRAIQRNPAERFANARELVDALGVALDLPAWPSSADSASLGARGPFSSSVPPSAGSALDLRSSAPPPFGAAPNPHSSMPPQLEPTVPQARSRPISRWTRTLKGTGSVPPLPPLPPPPNLGAEARRPSQTPVPRSSAADLPTKASNIRFANNEPATRPSAKLPALVPSAHLVPEASNTPAGHTTSVSSLSRTDVRRRVSTAPESMRSLGVIALGAAALLAVGGTISRLAPVGTSVAGASPGSVAPPSNEPARLLSATEPLQPPTALPVATAPSLATTLPVAAPPPVTALPSVTAPLLATAPPPVAAPSPAPSLSAAAPSVPSSPRAVPSPSPQRTASSQAVPPPSPQRTASPRLAPSVQAPPQPRGTSPAPAARNEGDEPDEAPLARV